MVRIHKEGYKFLSVLFILGFTVNLIVLMLDISQWIKIIIIFLIFIEFLFFLQFFRSPIINKNTGQNKIISPANGEVVHIGEVYEDEYFNDKKIMISIFMSPLDVHINRNPISGVIKYYKYHKGKYLVAWHPKSSKLNERTTTVIENDKIEIMVRQIAGFVARRIVNYSKEGAKVKQCDQMGFIKFGSRADIFLPIGTKVSVKKNQKTVGGETEIANLA
ncbi:MAG: phosphatidylserine decarboxylase family protein [Marinoscillum sp.]|nr:phosphatidylserine decarboxylase family protein [Marinoscillum sp.]